MRRPPPLTRLLYYPITTPVIALAIAVTLLWWARADISFLFMDFRGLRSQPWRLITSSLPHLDIFHLFYNLYWLWVFGTCIEEQFGALRSLGIFSLFAAGSAAAEYAVFDGGVGLSGVGYGLLGMLWVLSYRDERFADSVDYKTVSIFVGWFFLCILLSAIGVWQVANVAHGAGALLGVLLGFAISARTRQVRALGWIAIGATTAAVLLASLWGRQFINLSPNVGLDLARAGHLELTEGHPRKAVRLLQEAVTLNPGQADWWQNLAIAHQRLGQDANAADAYEKALGLRPQSKELRQTVAWFKAERAYRHLEQRDYAAAVRLYREALNLDDRQANYWYNLGVSLLGSGDRTGGLDAVKRAVELEPGDPRYAKALRELQGPDGP